MWVKAGNRLSQVVNVNIKQPWTQDATLEKTTGARKNGADLLIDNKLGLAAREERVNELNEWRWSGFLHEFIQELWNRDSVIGFLEVQEDGD